MIFRSDLFFAAPLEISLVFEIAREMSLSARLIQARQDAIREGKSVHSARRENRLSPCRELSETERELV